MQMGVAKHYRVTQDSTREPGRLAVMLYPLVFPFASAPKRPSQNGKGTDETLPFRGIQSVIAVNCIGL